MEGDNTIIHRDKEKNEYYIIVNGERLYIGGTADFNVVSAIDDSLWRKRIEDTIDSLAQGILSSEGVI